MNSNRRKAWIFLGVTPIALVLGIVISEWLYSSLGYEVGTTSAPIRIKILMIFVSFAIIFTLPAISIVFSRRAISEGDPKAKTPDLIAIIFIIGYGLNNLLSLLVTLR